MQRIKRVNILCEAEKLVSLGGPRLYQLNIALYSSKKLNIALYGTGQSQRNDGIILLNGKYILYKRLIWRIKVAPKIIERGPRTAVYEYKDLATIRSMG